MSDQGLTHVALAVADMSRSLAFYGAYAAMRVVHERVDAQAGTRVAWITDGTRPFVIVLIESQRAEPSLRPMAHLGVGCVSRARLDELCARARGEGVLIDGPTDSPYPVGYWAFLADPDGNTLELSHGQEIGLTVSRAGPQTGPRAEP
jgi:catechol 2,3-dioxygenase-like lactoylglutathione lyase family enzyme